MTGNLIFEGESDLKVNEIQKYPELETKLVLELVEREPVR